MVEEEKKGPSHRSASAHSNNSAETLAINEVKAEDCVQDEEIFPSLLEIQKRKYAEFVVGADAYVPEVILARPKKRSENVGSLREELVQLNTEILAKKEQILNKIRESMYNAETDEGFLETAMSEYENCYLIDIDKSNSLIDDEVSRIETEMKIAQEEAEALIKKMQAFLKQNHKVVQDFLKNSHMAVYQMSRPPSQRQQVSTEFAMDPRQLASHKKKAEMRSRDISSAQSGAQSGRSMETDDVGESPAWEPNLQFLTAVGIESAHKIQWPNMSQVKMLNLTQQLKLNMVQLGVSSNLYEMRLGFCGDVESEKICTNQTYGKDTKLRQFKIDMSRRIASMSLNLNQQLGNIFAMRLVDDQGEFLLDEQWFVPSEEVETIWQSVEIPDGKEIIGVHGTHDGDYMTNLGLIVWTPNPDAKKILQ